MSCLPPCLRSSLVIGLLLCSPGALAATHAFGGTANGATKMGGNDCVGMMLKINTDVPELTRFSVEMQTDTLTADLYWYVYAVDTSLMSSAGYSSSWWQGDLVAKGSSSVTALTATDWVDSPDLAEPLPAGPYALMACWTAASGKFGVISEGAAIPGELIAGDPNLGGKDSDLESTAGPYLGDPETFDIVPTGTHMRVVLLEDRDGDGATDDVDCDDNDPLRSPDFLETCSGIDDDCDGLVDDDDPSVDLDTATDWYDDLDGDGFGDPSSGTPSCGNPGGMVLDDTDCDDGDLDIHPGAHEICNQTDDDCDALVDEDDPDLDWATASDWYWDDDGDGYGDPNVGQQACFQPSGWLANDHDCDDTDPTINPDTRWFHDGDGDSYGDAFDWLESCLQPVDHVSNSDDCNDVDPDRNPDTVWYQDDDGDSFGDAAHTMVQCIQPSGHVLDDEDCDDADAAIHPDTWWHADVDGDTYGDPAVSQQVCVQPSGHVLDDQDCDDTDPGLSPETIWYGDADGDGYGSPSGWSLSCLQPPNTSATNDDCAPNHAAIHPGASEVCDGIDNDCDGLYDDDDPSLDQNTTSTWYADDDGDGYGDPGQTTDACAEPSGYLANDEDCDDDDAAVYPGAVESCNGQDDDCDGDVDEAVLQTSTESGEDFTDFVLYEDTVLSSDSEGQHILLTPDANSQAGAAVVAITPPSGSWEWAAYFTIEIPSANPGGTLQGMVAGFFDTSSTIQPRSYGDGQLGFFGAQFNDHVAASVGVEFDVNANPHGGVTDHEASSQYSNHWDDHVAITLANQLNHVPTTLDWGAEFWDGSPIYLNDGTEWPVKLVVDHDDTLGQTWLEVYMHMDDVSTVADVEDADALDDADWTEGDFTWELISEADVTGWVDTTGFRFGWTATTSPRQNPNQAHQVDSVYFTCPG